MVIANPAVWEGKSQKKSQKSIREHDKHSVTLKSRADPFSHIRDVKSYLAYQPSCRQLQPSGFPSNFPPRQLLYVDSPWGTSHSADSSSRWVLSPPCSYLPKFLLWLTVAFCFQTCCWSWKKVPTESNLFNKTHSKLCSQHSTGHLTILLAHALSLFSCSYWILHTVLFIGTDRPIIHISHMGWKAALGAHPDHFTSLVLHPGCSSHPAYSSTISESNVVDLEQVKPSPDPELVFLLTD